jgi:hypothetical protein
LSLRFASHALCNYIDVVLKAVSQNGHAIKYVKIQKIHIENRIILTALAQNGQAINHISYSYLEISNLRSIIKDYVVEYDLVQRSIIIFLVGSCFTTSNNILSKLNKHGPHFASLFKKRIAEYVYGHKTDGKLIIAAGRNILI